MKKVIMTSLLASAMFTTGAVSAASSGTITFNGELTANTCDVSVDGQGADATVTLPTVSVSQLDKATKTSGQTGFNMTLSNCSGTLESASAFFEAGPSLDLSTGRLINLSGTAENVSLELLDASSASYAVIQAGNQNQITNTTYKDISSGSATLPYAIRYYAEAPTTAGTVNSNIVYSIQYQ